MIKKLDWSHDNIVAYEASGTLSKEENQQVFSELREIIAKQDKIRLYVKLPEIAFPDLNAISERLSFAKDHLKDIERYVLVSNIKAMEWVSKLAGIFTGIEFRHYSLEDEALAKAWIESIHR
ncbi:STAS/SEC14 domain-containing protein [Chitinispirillales bacterium ANBcel5]|uniref:STAS/SEC14 domain-containing protein n=1 Tax=Cellulosispirillum alkaliphilum TaxID=3039283 RepID=UPI002A579441|nr:STAS/SEC14 domain-containing protein [Chitinispirillales bacterium ANBcel5]